MALTQRAYLKNPNVCPYCGSVVIEAGQWDGETAAQKVICLDCEKGWSDLYILHGYEEIPK